MKKHDFWNRRLCSAWAACRIGWVFDHFFRDRNLGGSFCVSQLVISCLLSVVGDVSICIFCSYWENIKSSQKWNEAFAFWCYAAELWIGIHWNPDITNHSGPNFLFIIAGPFHIGVQSDMGVEKSWRSSYRVFEGNLLYRVFLRVILVVSDTVGCVERTLKRAIICISLGKF